MTIVEAAPGITGGVDTHLDNHVAAALDPLGRLVGTESFSADAAGYKALFGWLEDFGEVTKVGVKAPLLWERAGTVPPPQGHRSRRSEPSQSPVPSQPGKSDPLDAVEAARAAISGRATDGQVQGRSGEAIRVLVVAKRSARQARIKAITQMRHLGVTAPEQLHCRLRASPSPRWSPMREAAPGELSIR